MKTAIITIGLAIFSVASLFAQHVPPNHGDSGPTICWGYSVGRAFGKTWTQTSDCNSRIINKNEVGNKQGDLYFDWYPNYSASNINVGDIIEFGPGHVAYVTGTVSGIKLDFVENEDSDVEKKDIPIDWVINGHSNPDVVARGNPTGYTGAGRAVAGRSSCKTNSAAAQSCGGRPATLPRTLSMPVGTITTI